MWFVPNAHARKNRIIDKTYIECLFYLVESLPNSLEMRNSNSHDANDLKSYAVIGHQQWIYVVTHRNYSNGEQKEMNEQTNEV